MRNVSQCAVQQCGHRRLMVWYFYCFVHISLVFPISPHIAIASSLAFTPKLPSSSLSLCSSTFRSYLPLLNIYRSGLMMFRLDATALLVSPSSTNPSELRLHFLPCKYKASPTPGGCAPILSGFFLSGICSSCHFLQASQKTHWQRRAACWSTIV